MEHSTLHSLSLFTITLLFLTLTLLLSSQLASADRDFGCSSAYCGAYGNCPEMSCRGKGKVLLRNVTECGCCHRCVEEKAEGQSCPLDITGNLPGNQCAPHFRCTKPPNSAFSRDGTCQPISSKCEDERRHVEASSSQLSFAQAKPDCDQFGEFIPKRCKNGTICQCVNEEGTEIFGLAPYNEAKEMNCLCARQFHLVNSKLAALGSKQLAPINFMRCKANGNFEPYQTHLHYAYCVHEANGTMWDRPVVLKSQKDLPCFEKSSYHFKTPCIREYNEAVKNRTEKEKSYRVVGYDLPNCDLDGSYAPVQCRNDKCFCVDSSGKKLKGPQNKVLEVSRNDFAFTRDMLDCPCARQLEVIRSIKTRHRNKVTDLFGRYQCDKNGNYLPIQCSDTACYCVSPQNGYLLTDESADVLSSALRTEPEKLGKLFCFSQYPEKARLKELLKLPADLPNGDDKEKEKEANNGGQQTVKSEVPYSNGRTVASVANSNDVKFM